MNKKNVVKDFVNVAGPLGVTHFLMLSKTEMGTYLVCLLIENLKLKIINVDQLKLII